MHNDDSTAAVLFLPVKLTDTTMPPQVSTIHMPAAMPSVTRKGFSFALALIMVSWLASVAAPAAAQTVTPTANYTDLWYTRGEDGWGMSLTQKPASGGGQQLFGVWYTYDPRRPDTTTAEPNDLQPLWLTMTAGNWVTPTRYEGRLFVTSGTFYALTWNAANLGVQDVGSFSLTFSDANTAVYNYAVAPPANLQSTNPAFGLNAFSGSKTIVRLAF
jgi:hypothetical protein